jgi:hypothetical protein
VAVGDFVIPALPNGDLELYVAVLGKGSGLQFQGYSAGFRVIGLGLVLGLDLELYLAA